MRVLVTGNRGFIGTELCNFLNSQGVEVVGCDRRDYQEVCSIDVTDADAIVHLAAQTSVINGDIDAMIKDNITAFHNIVRISNLHGIRLIYASSSCSINATSMYGLTKKLNEEYASIYAENSLGLRFHNVYGKNSREDTLLGIIKESIKSGCTIKLYNGGNNTRHFTYVGDIVKCIYNQLNSSNTGVMSICNPQEITTLEFVNEVRKYATFNYELVPQKRKFDKEKQRVEFEGNIRMDYTSVEDGIREIFR